MDTVNGGGTIKHWHVIQVLGGTEDRFIKQIQHDRYVAFVPKKTKVFKRKDVLKKVEEPLFRGYVFVETDEDHLCFLYHLNDHIKPVKGFLRLLRHDRSIEETVLPHERAFIEKFTNHRKVIEVSIGVIVGDKVIVTEGPLMGMESMIVRVDRHKRTAYLEVDFFDRIQTVEVGLNVIQKVETLNGE